MLFLQAWASLCCLECENEWDVILQEIVPPAHPKYRWVPLKPDFLGAWKSVQLKHYPAYPIIIISLITQRNVATKIRAKWESGLTAVRLKWDPSVYSWCWCCGDQAFLPKWLISTVQDVILQKHYPFPHYPKFIVDWGGGVERFVIIFDILLYTTWN